VHTAVVCSTKHYTIRCQVEHGGVSRVQEKRGGGTGGLGSTGRTKQELEKYHEEWPEPHGGAESKRTWNTDS
jgi:hypothetical protein